MIKKNFYIIIIFIIALLLRVFGINWDSNQHLHPDERFLTMLSSTISFPNSIFQYFDTASSPLNPFNYQEFNFFVYGTFPIFITKIFAHLFNLETYTNIHFVGRFLSAIFDSLNIFLLYFLAKIIFKNKYKSYIYLPSILYATTVFPIQLSHFFAVDTFLNFFILLTFVSLSYWVYKQKNIYLYLSAIAYGIAFACKISSIIFSPIILFFFLYNFYLNKKINYFSVVFYLFVSFFVFRIFQPYSFISLFKVNPDLLNSLNYLKLILINKDVFYPPEIQWLSKTIIIYPLQNIIFFGAGIPLSFLFIKSILNIFLIKFKNIKKENFIIIMLFAWFSILFIYQGTQFTHTMRYFLFLYPPICFLSVYLNLIKNSKNIYKLFVAVFVFHFIYLSTFLSIYTRPHSRVQATNWINSNVENNSVIANEYWDDPLPLYNNFYNKYKIEMLPIYDEDNLQKWQKINETLDSSDYLILSSNRLWSSIPLVPKRYPLSTVYYQNLFENNSQFKKIKEFNSYPGLSISFMKRCIYFGPTNYPYKNLKNKWFEIDSECNFPGIYLRDDISEEAFTVYDHPKVIIFKKEN